MINTNKLEDFSNRLRNLNKYTDAIFIENLVAAIKSNPLACNEIVKSWLVAAFNFPFDYEKDNCFDTYNRSFYAQILENL